MTASEREITKTAEAAPEADDQPDGQRTRRRNHTAKGEATRRVILDTALTLFAEKGFHKTTVPDIVEAAGIGHGTFYQYFENRRDVLLELTKEAEEQGTWRPYHPRSSLAEGIRMEILWYFSDFVHNLELCKIWDQAEAFDPDVREARYKLREQRVARIRRAIEMIGPPGINAVIASTALLAMLEEFAQRWFIELDGESTPRDVFEVAQTIANLWINAFRADEASPVGSERAKR